MSGHDYVHGYSSRENTRLFDQANTLAELLHRDTFYPAGSKVLEAGCGVGAQTAILARNSPRARFTSIDISPDSLNAARALIEKKRITNVTFQMADIFDLPYEEEYFDHVFVCFVLEHLKKPVEALRRLRVVLKKGGSITVIEGDHGSTFFHPDSQAAMRTIQCLVQIQSRTGGNALIGRQLFPILRNAGFDRPVISPRMVYTDSSRPELVDGFTKKTFIAMVEGVGEQALEMNLLSSGEWKNGISDLRAAAKSDGVFCYTFFKGRAVR